MISFFRRALSSWLVLGLLGLIMIAFIVTGIGTPGSLGDLGGGIGDDIAEVDGKPLGANEAARRVQTQLESARQQQPGLDMGAFVVQGGVERTIDQMINSLSLHLFARDQGMVASKKLVDGAIASIPSFNGPTGAFDRNVFLAALAQRKVSEAQIREDFGREALAKQLVIPAAGAAIVSNALVAPYADLLLEGRDGLVGFVPSAAFAPKTPPTEADLQTFYKRNLARYTVPERRLVRYTVFTREQLLAKSTPSEAEIAAAYKANAAKYAGRELRVLSQVILPTQAAANALAAKVRGGTPIAAAARAAGLDAATLDARDKPSFAGLSSPAVADAAFAAPQGGVAAPAKSGLGWHVVRVDEVNQIVAKPLAAARGELIADLVQTKTDAALADLVTRIEDQVAEGATFDEAAKANALTVVATPAVTASGRAPDQPGYRPPPELQPILTDAFVADPDDDPAVITLAPNTAFAFYDLDRVVPATPRPLAQIREQVVRDFTVDRASRAAKTAADAIVARVNKGMPLAQAMSGAGVALPAPERAGGRRMEVTAQRQQVPPPVALLFSMKAKTAKVLEAPDKQGWFVVYLDSIQPGDARTQPGLAQATRQQLSGVIGDEYVEQFVKAIQAGQGVERNTDAIARLKRSLTGATGQ